MFKTAIANNQVAAIANETAQELKGYKSVYYGLRSVAYALYIEIMRETWKVEGLFQQYIIAPGVRQPDGSYADSEIDWQGYRAEKNSRFDEQFAIPHPIELSSLKSIQAAKRKLSKMVLQDAEWEPLLESLQLAEESTACLFEKLRQINADNYDRKRAAKDENHLPTRDDLITDPSTEYIPF